MKKVFAAAVLIVLTFMTACQSQSSTEKLPYLDMILKEKSAVLEEMKVEESTEIGPDIFEIDKKTTIFDLEFKTELYFGEDDKLMGFRLVKEFSESEDALKTVDDTMNLIKEIYGEADTYEGISSSYFSLENPTETIAKEKTATYSEDWLIDEEQNLYLKVSVIKNEDLYYLTLDCQIEV